MRFILLMLPFLAFAKTQNEEKFNSSLLVEVTRKNGIFTCTGVAVSSKVVLTAAHCLEGKVEQVKIFPQKKYNQKLSHFNAKSYELHESYNPKKSQYKSDIAKIYLENNLPADINIPPLFSQGTISGKLFRLGFGGRDDQNIRTQLSLEPRSLQNEVLELNDQYSLSGDSGGPIFLEQDQKIYLLAIHSTLSFGPAGKFSYNPLLAPFKEWIYKN